MSHTPGPWSLKNGAVSQDITAQSKRGKTWTVARTTAAKVGRDQADANARLIAAAPDLLAALKNSNAAMHLLLPFMPDRDAAPIDEQMRLNRAAIAKAEGK